MTKFRMIMLTGVAAMAAMPMPLYAQDAAVDDSAATGEIVVTARRQNELLSEVPASVTVLTADTIAKTGIETADDFIQLTPGVTIVTGTAEAGDTQINIRGINGARDAESSVALVVDGILKTNTAQLNQNQGTLRQIEILKGPQGALYGRNAAAGAIVISTLKPGDRFEGGVKASYANEQTFEGSAYVSGPISENLGFVLSGYYRTTDGFYRNSFLNAKVVDDQEIWSVDGRLVAQLGEATSLDVKARYADLSGASINFNAAFHLPNFAGVNPAFYEDVNDHPFNFYNNIRPQNDQQTFEASIKLDHDFGPVTLTAWGLYSDVEQSLTADGTSADFARYITATFTPGADTVASQTANDQCFATTASLTGFPVNQPGFIGSNPIPFIFDPANGSTFGPYSPTTCDGTQYQERNQSDYSAEVRIASNGNGPLNWQLGGYYLHIDRDVGVSLGADLGQGIIPNLFNDANSANPTSQLYSDNFTTDVYAAFGSVDYKPTESLSLSAALRYDIEDRAVSNRVPLVLDPITGAPINPGQVNGAIPDQSASFKQLQPKLSLRYEIAPRTNIYANWGIGFKAGGFNNSGSAAVVDQNFVQFINADVVINDNYRKEKSSAFEAGIRGSLIGGRINFDLAGYYTNVTDMQFFEFFVGSFGLLRVVSNIDKVELYGAELNVNAEIVPGWKVFGSGNFTNSEIKRNSSRPITVGNKSPYTADYTINLGTQIEVPVADDINVLLRADYRITGPTYFHTVQEQEIPTLFSGLLPTSPLGLPAFVGNGEYSITRREAFGVLNGRIGVEADRWGIAVFAENLLNRRYLNEVITAVEFGGSFISPGGRRLIGVEGTLKF